MTRVVDQMISWINASPGQRIRPRFAAVDAAIADVVMTGPGLVDRIVQAIALDQSVLLTGPRGCGKSRSISDAIDRAGKAGILVPEKSRVFLQGNREIPRDYLAEDEIAFKTEASGNKLEVIPDLRPAPLFRFAARDPVSRQVKEKKGARDSIQEVEWDLPMNNGAPQRFVLFLDEINRFSDGVLDSLLSVLEERTAVLGGREYRVPAVVCMTMNPPGYDGSARRLSPPLAARIGRSFRLATPDLDTLTDIILPGRLEKARALHKETFGNMMDFPEVQPNLCRRAALVTLCLWGDFTTKTQGREYLTPSTHELLSWAAGSDAQVRHAMREISKVCQFGPDGRALGDWTVAAVGAARQEALVSGARYPQVEERHFLDTVVESLAHKLYDNFSPASNPEMTVAKEAAIRLLAQRILTVRVFERRVDREVDDPKFWSDPHWRTLFLEHGLTVPADIKQLQQSFKSLQELASEPIGLAANVDVAKILIRNGVAQRSSEGDCVFKTPAHQRVSIAAVSNEDLLKVTPEWRDLLAHLFQAWSLERDVFGRTLKTMEPFGEYISIASFLKECDRYLLDGTKRRKLATTVEALWNAVVDAEGSLELAIERAKDRASEFADGTDADERDALVATLTPLLLSLKARNDEHAKPDVWIVRMLRRFSSPPQKDAAVEHLKAREQVLDSVLMILVPPETAAAGDKV